jgi:hypothetical protein
MLDFLDEGDRAKIKELIESLDKVDDERRGNIKEAYPL